MYTPAILFAFSGIVVGLGTLFTTEAIFGEMATAGHLWFDCWNVLLQGGWTLFNQMPLLFCVALPISLANKQNARCCMEALAIYLTFNYFVSTILGQWGPVFGVDYSVEAGSGTGLATIASIKTLDMGIMGALIISGIATMLHNKYFDTELPEWLGVFSGSVFIYMIGFFVMVPVALIACLVWPHVQAAISAFQGFILSAGTFGVGVFAFFERVLIPTGLHHFIYTPFYSITTTRRSTVASLLLGPTSCPNWLPIRALLLRMPHPGLPIPALVGLRSSARSASPLRFI